MEQYINELYGYEQDEDLKRVIASIASNNMPQISVPPSYGRLLTVLTKTAGVKRALEIGALGGYSGICIARGLGDDGTLLSLELKDDFAQIAKENIDAAGLGHKVSYRIGDAKATLQQLIAERVQFDLFFIDADKGGYPFYLECALQLASPGALIVADNTLQKGKIADESIQSPSVLAMRAFNRTIAEHPRLDSTMLPAFDGLAIARVKV